jgi:leukotriene-A4 hydrolase
VAPLQDTPAIKATYEAYVTVPEAYVVKMSATDLDVVVSGTNKIYHFEQTIPIPSYLLAIAAGNLVYQSLGTRTGVVTEPTMLASCAAELEDLETLL